MKKGTAILIAALWLPVGATAAPAPKPAPDAAAFDARVVAVIDGATLRVRTPDKAETLVRLRNIETPDPCQPGADGAKQALVDLALGQPVSVRAAGRDAQGRTLATVRLAGADLSTRMVEEGQAWSARGRSDRGPLVKQEKMARALGRGLHGQPGTLPPTEWRQQHGACPGVGR